jgi:hypothetical protein
MKMIPDRKWFPSSLQERAAWFENFNTHIQVLGAGFGLTVAELGHIADDNDMVQFLGASTVTVNAYDDAIRLFRKTVTEGGIGEPDAAFPANFTLTAPGGVATGIFERLDDFVKRIRVASTFTPETGGILGINTSGGGPNIPTGSVRPVIKASVHPGNVVEVKFTRGDSDGIYIETNIDNGGWTFTEKAFRSPAIFTVDQNPANTPRGVQIRVRSVDGNTPVGDYSDIATVQTIP